jgi:hypothetical protein
MFYSPHRLTVGDSPAPLRDFNTPRIGLPYNSPARSLRLKINRGLDRSLRFQL